MLLAMHAFYRLGWLACNRNHTCMIQLCTSNCLHNFAPAYIRACILKNADYGAFCRLYYAYANLCMQFNAQCCNIQFDLDCMHVPAECMNFAHLHISHFHCNIYVYFVNRFSFVTITPKFCLFR